ncbi:uncharacterized protein N7459_002112 [Penicillium hispanicum]|uniref:uncharacterized protein n=1 Tax=Penicillium hispanicum TaxID=1080232 RepID=UPI00253FBFBA|nr:uncharacterized protein N7459_002112 [Penicillium hispanicum]KAJ5591743.1 hypothetical protein N7459_002112 [Penicillium hispanicum]
MEIVEFVDGSFVHAHLVAGYLSPTTTLGSDAENKAARPPRSIMDRGRGVAKPFCSIGLVYGRA